MKKQSCIKKLVGLALVLVMMFALVPVTTVNAANVPRMESTINTSIYTRRSSFADNIEATRAYILHSNGELWAYLAGLPNNPTGFASALVMTDIIAFTSNPTMDRSFSATNFYGGTAFTGIALGTDGTVWLCIMGMERGAAELTAHVEQIDSDAVQISSNLWLKADGELFSGEPLRSVTDFDGSVNTHTERVAQNIIDIARNIHLPATRTLEVNNATLTNIQRMYDSVGGGRWGTFALTTDGRLYGWGINTHGRVGVGPVFDRAWGISDGWNLQVERPRHVMDNVATMYFDDNRVYARDTSGQLWVWGDGEPATVAAGNNVVWPTDQRHLTPRLAGYNEPRYTSINGVTIRQDGTLWVQSLDRNSNVTHDIQLPINFNQVMGASGTATQQAQTTTTTTTGSGATTPNLTTASAWAHEHINRALTLNLLPQSLQNNYQNNITRAEFSALAVALYETATGRTITERATFNDTNDINVQKMGGLGVVGGVGDGNFNPNGTITREQAAVMISRLADALGQPLPQSAPTFADNAQISSWAVDAVGQMQATGIMGGTGNNNFSPSGTFTREQSIITILRLFDLLQ